MVVILLADGFEEIEALAPLDIMRRADIDVRTVSIGKREVTGTHGITVLADMTSDELKLDEVDTVIFPGGMPGALNLDAAEITDRLILQVTQNGGRLAAICAAPLILGRRGLLEGKRATCFPGFEGELRGAKVCDTDVVTDGNIITARNFKAALDFGNALVKKLTANAEDEATASLLLDCIDGDEKEEIIKNVNVIIDTLSSHNVNASITAIERGPRITSYAIVPGEGETSRTIAGVFDDIVINLSADSVRMIEPTFGKSAVILEIPNKNPDTVRLCELIESEEFKTKAEGTALCIGKDVAGTPVFGDMAELPHLIVTGATGMGKSVCINALLLSLLSKSSPDELKLILIDPKRVELTNYKGLPHLLTPVITETNDAVGALAYAIAEMERRYTLFERAEARNLDKYNSVTPSEKLPRIVIVIDELNDLMLQAGDTVGDLIMRIAQKARAAGIHVIVATQRPSPSVLTGTVKANIPARICFKVASARDSRTAIDMVGAEKLLPRGDMLLQLPTMPIPIRVQGCFVSDNEVTSAVKAMKEKYGTADNGDAYLSAIRAEYAKYASYSHGSLDEDDEDAITEYLDDEKFLQAVEIAIDAGKASTSLLQRKLCIGYGKAAKYIDAMEDIGIIGEKVGAKPQDVLITMDEWQEKLERALKND